jgi:hypothetical protein
MRYQQESPKTSIWEITADLDLKKSLFGAGIALVLGGMTLWWMFSIGPALSTRVFDGKTLFEYRTTYKEAQKEGWEDAPAYRTGRVLLMWPDRTAVHSEWKLLDGDLRAKNKDDVATLIFVEELPDKRLRLVCMDTGGAVFGVQEIAEADLVEAVENMPER